MYSNESTAGPKPQFEMGELRSVSNSRTWAHIVDKEGEDKFCRFVDRMPPVSSDSQRSCIARDATHSLLRNPMGWSGSLTEE